MSTGTGVVPLPTISTSASPSPSSPPLPTPTSQPVHTTCSIALHTTFTSFHLTELLLKRAVQNALLRYPAALLPQNIRDTLIVVEGSFQLPVLTHTRMMHKLLDEPIISHFLEDLSCFLALP